MEGLKAVRCVVAESCAELSGFENIDCKRFGGRGYVGCASSAWLIEPIYLDCSAFGIAPVR